MTTPEWPVIDFNCEPVLRVTKIGQFPEHQDLRGSYRIVMSAGGVPNLIYGSPYYHNTEGGKNHFLHWMWHGPVGHWIINDTPGNA